MRSLWWEWLDNCTLFQGNYMTQREYDHRLDTERRFICFVLLWIRCGLSLFLNFSLLHTSESQSGHLCMYAKSRTTKKAGCWRIDAFRLRWWRKLLDCKELKTVNLKENQPWIFTGRIVAEAEAPILQLPDAKSWLIGKDWCWERGRSGGDKGNRGWDGWMASLTQWTWVWGNSGRWWRTAEPGVL